MAKRLWALYGIRFTPYARRQRRQAPAFSVKWEALPYFCSLPFKFHGFSGCGQRWVFRGKENKR